MPQDKSFDDVTANQATIAGKTADSADPFALESDTGAATAYPKQAPDGQIHGWNMGGSDEQHVNPADYADASAAVQDAVDTLETAQASGEQGVVWIPHTDPNDNELVFPSQVTFNSTLPSFYGSVGEGGPYIQITITNGDPAFYLNNIKSQGHVIRGPNASGNGNDCEFIRFYDGTGYRYSGGDLRAFCGPSSATAKGAIVCDSRAYNGHITDVKFNGLLENSGETDVTGMVCIGADNTDGGSTDEPGEWGVGHITGFAATTSPIKSFVSDNGFNFRNVRIMNCRLEGSGSSGNGLVDFTSGYPIVIGNEAGRTEGGADRIHVTGFRAAIGPNFGNGPTDTGGNAVYIRCGGTVQNWGKWGNNAAHAIDANFSPGGDVHVQLPDPAAIGGGETVSYQSGASQLHVVQTSNPS